MRLTLSRFFATGSLLQTVTAHYVFAHLFANGQWVLYSTAIRQPPRLNPIHVELVPTKAVRCNMNPQLATDVVAVQPGSEIGFGLADGLILYHPGPAAVYLGKAPDHEDAGGAGGVRTWDGSGENWFKIAEWSATFNPSAAWQAQGRTNLTATIPGNTPPGEYLVRAEHVGLHITREGQFYISCAQIRVTGNGTGDPPKIAIPGADYALVSDPGLSVNIWDSGFNEFKVHGPDVWRG